MNTISKVMKSTSAKAIGLLIAVMMLGGALTANAAALTEAQITAILGLLSSFGADQAVIDNVNSSLRGTPTTGGTGTPSSGFTWTKSLSLGSTGNDVLELQRFLNRTADTQVAASGVGSPGNETNFFGSLTGVAVAKFQMKFASEILTPIGLTSGTPFFGVMTRAKANSLNAIAGTTPGDGTTVVVPAGTGLAISAAVQPANSLAPNNAARVPFTRINLTAGSDGAVTVNSIVVERGGLGADIAFAGIVLLDENGVQIGIAKTLNSAHQVTVGTAFTIPAGATKTFTIAGNMALDNSLRAGEVPTLSVVAINTSATVSGALPITGAAHTINATLSIGGASAIKSSFDPATTANKEIGTTGYKFAGIRLTADSAEDIRLFSIRFNQNGSASAADLANVIIIVDGTSYATSVSADGNYYSAIFGGGIKIEKGLSKDVYIKGDIVGGSAAGRNIDFNIEEGTDINITGELFGYGVTVTGSGNGTEGTVKTGATPFYNAYLVTVNAGTATNIGKSNTVTAQNIAVNVPNQPLGGFETEFKGEAVTIQKIIIDVKTDVAVASSADLLINVSIVDQNGAVVAGPIDAVAVDTQTWTLTFTDAITFPVGKMVYTIKGKVDRDVVNGVVYTLDTAPTTQWTNVKGDVTGNTITLSQTEFFMNAMTVKAAALAITVSPNPAAQSITAGTQGFTYANYQFDASQSGEDVRFSAIPLKLKTTVMEANQVSNCRLYDNGVALNTSDVVNPSEATTVDKDYTFVLDSSLTIAKGTVKTLALKCDLSSSVDSGGGDKLQWGFSITATTSMTTTGLTSSNDVAETATISDGQLMTVNAGSITVSKDASSPSFKVASAGSTGVVAGVMKFRAANEAVTLERIGLILTNGAAADLIAVSIWDGGTKVGSAVFTGGSTNATSTLSSVVTLPKDTDKALTIKIDLAMVGTAQVGTQGVTIKVDVDANGSNTEGVGGAGKISATGSTAFPGVRMFKSFPTFAQGTLPSNGIGDGRLLRFTVTADAAGSVSVASFDVKFATSSATLAGVNIYAFTDAAYSQPVSGITANGQLSKNNITIDQAEGNEYAVLVQELGGGDTSIEIPAGGTRYFEVRGTVSGLTTGSSITTTLLGDGSEVSLNTSTSIGGNFVWSANKLGTSATTTADWTSGFGLLGLPSSGIISTRSN